MDTSNRAIDLSGGGGSAPLTAQQGPPGYGYDGGSAAKDAAYQNSAAGFEAARGGAAALGAQAMHHFRNHVQEGPAGISILCFFGGLMTAVVGALGFMGSFVGFFADPFHFLLNAYLALFGAVTVLLEADIEQVRQLRILGHLAPVLEGYQMKVEKKLQFLTELWGRGFFYLFIGSLAVTQCFFCFRFLVGLWNVVMGALCIMMSFGMNPADHMIVSPPPGGSSNPGI
eukprot:CAMPEP_0195156164 /NCGR_PEP_ID=MMETSP0448-20130528/184526_1 /TAXON_ID=66468 /ORGANISM="Heterocapsa triquestra, Strain CCMP 448" /LENGTH=227 /DNA_ID=CAMNT_0040194955 /DNA_START=82 /DNA_END=765 /DNA_ORIENTATION=+